MNADELLKRVIASGADEKGIQDRFSGNAELYEMCFHEFMEEENFAVLRDAISARDFKQAFEAAHALKGLSGNLGISAFYNAIRALTESLRHEQHEAVLSEYAEVERQYEMLSLLLADEPLHKNAQSEQIANSDAGQKPAKKANGRLLVLLLCASAAAILIVAFLFMRINYIHRQNVVKESGLHLAEMSRQIRLYVADHIANDWKMAYSVGDSIVNNSYSDDNSGIFKMMQRKQAVWDVSNIMLYTENGYCVYSNGETERNDVASENVYKAYKYGTYMSIIDSQLIYTVPIETTRQYGGSTIVAVSVVRDMESFLDEMEFSSFDGAGWMYLTDDKGVIISSLTNPSAVRSFNIQSIVNGMEIEPLNSAYGAKDIFTAPQIAVYLLSNGDVNNYCVSVPITAGVSSLHVFYFVPEEVVNDTMNDFSRHLTVFSLIFILLFAACAFLISLFMYKSKERLFSKALLARERMFDLLSKNTNTAFGLFSVNQERPSYISDNVPEVVGDKYWVVNKTKDGYSIRNDQNTDTDCIREVNALLKTWDGKSVFSSGYLKNTLSVSAPYFSCELYPVGEDGNDFVGIAQNVTHAYEREEAVKTAMEMANRSNEAKTKFLSNMSHDIRTPMNAIINMTNFALESIDQPKKLGSYLHVIRESAEHLLHLINDVLDMSRIESGQTFVSSAPFNIKAELQRQVNMIRPLCEAKGQLLMTDFSDIHTETVCGDALKLSQIIMNLLSNAVKFTPEKGAVRFIAKELPSLRDNIMNVRFTIEDNGIGISDADKKRIFEPFSRANDKKVSSIEGTGLGLSICKNYIDAMGGAIRCESEQGEGSIFTVELFFEKAGSAADSGEASDGRVKTSFLGMHCLVAEDNATNQLIAKELLERMGFIVDFANDGGEAVRMFVTSKPDTYDVIYMDIQMPVMDGYEATAQIRSSAHAQAKTIPIIAMTANAFAEDIEKARVAGMDAYVDKPVVSFNLAEQTTKALQKKRG